VRWDNEPNPEDGDRRTRSWFAWWPVTIGTQTRWLETVTVREEYRVPCLACGDPFWARRYFEDRAAGGE